MASPFLLFVLTFLHNQSCVEASSSSDIAPNTSSYTTTGKFQTFEQPFIISTCCHNTLKHKLGNTKMCCDSFR